MKIEHALESAVNGTAYPHILAQGVMIIPNGKQIKVIYPDGTTEIWECCDPQADIPEQLKIRESAS